MTRYRLLTLALLITLGAATPSFAQNNNGAPNHQEEAQIQWYTNYDDAVAEAQKDRKPLFLFFTGSDWCGWCKKMDQEVFQSPEFIQNVGKSFIFVDVDFPQGSKLPPEIAQQNTKLKQKYGITGFPTVIILDSNENFVAETGYRAGGGQAYADFLRGLLT